MKKSAYHLLIIICVLFSACRTPQEAANRHLRKAIALDPSIISKYTKDTLITGVAEGLVKVVTPESNGDFVFNCDSLQKAFDEFKKSTLPVGSVLAHTDSNIVVSVKKAGNGKFLINYNVKPKIIEVPVRIPYEVKVNVPGLSVKVPVDRPFYIYKWFWIMLSIILIALFLLYIKTRPIEYVKAKIAKLKGDKQP